MTLEPNTFLTRRDALQVLREAGLQLTESTLARWSSPRHQGGPRVARINGRVLYTREWLEQWLAKQVGANG